MKIDEDEIKNELDRITEKINILVKKYGIEIELKEYDCVMINAGQCKKYILRGIIPERRI